MARTFRRSRQIHIHDQFRTGPQMPDNIFWHVSLRDCDLTQLGTLIKEIQRTDVFDDNHDGGLLHSSLGFTIFWHIAWWGKTSFMCVQRYDLPSGG